MESYLGDEVMAARGYRLFPIRRSELPPGLSEEDTVVQEARWSRDHATGYSDIDGWPTEGKLLEEVVSVDGLELDMGHSFSSEVNGGLCRVAGSGRGGRECPRGPHYRLGLYRRFCC